jgi:hypothetical protein
MTAPVIQLRRGPRTDDELWWVIKALWGVEIPRIKVCPDHVAPFTALADAYFGREPGFAVWYASRGSGKSLALAILGLTKAFVDDVKVTILGGSMTQSQNVSAHMKDHLEFDRAPAYALRGGNINKGVTATQISLATGAWIRPIPASQTTVRGPHPPLTLLDEVDEMDYDIFVASLGQAMEQLNSRGELIGEYIVASSTWQNPIGTFTKVIEDARKKGQPVYSWCWRELLKTDQNPTGWMSERFINRKREQVTAEMWRTEYELNEPSGDSRAFDLTVLEDAFVAYPDPLDYVENGEDDQTWVWESPNPTGTYAVGADWAQEKDKTVIVCIRTDITPRRVVYLRRVNRQPYPKMMASFDKIVNDYNAHARHDRTGLGRVVNDFLDTAGDDRVAGFDFSGKKKRSQMLLAYINAVEKQMYVLPRGGPSYKMGGGYLAEFHKGHRGTTQGNVYGAHKDNGQGMSDPAGHLPDDVAAMALAHLAAGNAGVMEAQGVPTDPNPRRVDKPFHAKPFEDDEWVRSSSDVTIVDDRYEAPIADFGFLDLSI